MSGLGPQQSRSRRIASLRWLGVVAIVVGGVAGVEGFLAYRSSGLTTTRETMNVIRAAAYQWQVYHGDSICPSIRQLVEGKFLDANARKVDDWDQPFVITCMESGVFVTSVGPDKKRATADDIVVSPRGAVAGTAK